MILLRSSLFALALVILTPPYAILALCTYPLPPLARYRIISGWSHLVILLSRLILGIRYRVEGLENLPAQPAVILAKHQSAWETIFFCWLMPRPLIFVFKKELLYIPFFGWGLGMMRMIAIDRSKGRDAMSQVIQTGRRRLDDGQWVIMFPEGTRTPVGQQGKYKAGGAILAIGTKTPVVPIAMNSGDCWPRNAFIKKPGLITVSIGKPISPEGLSSAELMAQVENWIESEMRVITPAAYAVQTPASSVANQA